MVAPQRIDPGDGATGKKPQHQGTLLTVLVVIAVGGVLYFLQGVLIPLVLAFFLSYIAMPVVRLGRRVKIPVALSLLLVLFLFGLLLSTVSDVAYTSGADFVERTNDWGNTDQSLLDQALSALHLEGKVAAQLKDELQTRLSTLLAGLLGGVVNSLSFAILVLLFLTFIILDRGHGVMDERIVRAFSKNGPEQAQLIVTQVHAEIERYILIKTGLSLTTGLLVSLVIWIFGLPYVALFGILTFLFNFIPNVGSIVATLPPLLVGLVTFHYPLEVLPLLISLATIQFGVGNILEPIMLGRHMRLNPITVLLSLVFWGWLWGFWGMVLAVPLTAVIRIILDGTHKNHPVAMLMS